MIKNIFLVVIVAGIIGAIFYLQPQAPARPSQEAVTKANIPVLETKETIDKAKLYPVAKELTGIAGYINADGITIKDLIGKKVIIVDFWTYSCINCQRTIPYVNQWYSKYKDKGLEIIGVHTPEFGFEKEYKNVVTAVKGYNIQYPVVLDNDYATWNAYGNRYWPRKYIIDIDGFIVYDHIGEGAYEETEKEIQGLLAERMKKLGLNENVNLPIQKPAGVVERKGGPLTPEIYFGALRNASYFGNATPNSIGVQTLTQPDSTKLQADKVYLTGKWGIEKEYAESLTPNNIITIRYKGQQVYFVGSALQPIKIKLLRDGRSLGSEAGKDVVDSTVTIQQDRLYKLIEDSENSEHTLEMIIEQPGLKAFTFTFG